MDFKELFKRLSAAGAGRPVDEDGVPEGPWTPELLAEAITQIDANRVGIDLRTVQLWFQDNDKGISAENIRWLARVFGCNDPDATSAWQAELSAAHRRLVAKRRARASATKRSADHESDDGVPKPKTSTKKSAEKTIEFTPRHRFNLAESSETLFASRSSLNLPAMVWAGCVTLGFLAYILRVHSVTYNPISGLTKQVGFFWAPNWTLLEMVFLPLFLVGVGGLLTMWKAERCRLIAQVDPERISKDEWMRKVASFSFSHWAVLFICVVVVFLLQWSGLHLRALLNGEAGNLMMDWNLIAIVRPEVISVPQATMLSMFAFMYSAAICYLFLTGLVFLYTVAQDFQEIASSPETQSADNCQGKGREIGGKLIGGVFRCAVLGIWVATCIKLQASYLLSDASDILRWLFDDAAFALGVTSEPNGWLEQRTLAHFTSFLLMFSTCSVFLFCFSQIYQVVEWPPSAENSQEIAGAQRVPWGKMLSVVTLLVVNFLLIGQIPGFSILMIVGAAVSIISLLDPEFSWVTKGRTTQAGRK